MLFVFLTPWHQQKLVPPKKNKERNTTVDRSQFLLFFSAFDRRVIRPSVFAPSSPRLRPVFAPASPRLRAVFAREVNTSSQVTFASISGVVCRRTWSSRLALKLGRSQRDRRWACLQKKKQPSGGWFTWMGWIELLCSALLCPALLCFGSKACWLSMAMNIKAT